MWDRRGATREAQGVGRNPMLSCFLSARPCWVQWRIKGLPVVAAFCLTLDFYTVAGVVRPSIPEPFEKATVAYRKNHWTGGMQNGVFPGIS